MPHEEARNFIEKDWGRHNDPACVDAFLTRWEQCRSDRRNANVTQ